MIYLTSHEQTKAREVRAVINVFWMAWIRLQFFIELSFYKRGKINFSQF